MLVLRAGIHWLTDACQNNKQGSMRCLSRPLWQATSVQNLKTFTIPNLVLVQFFKPEIEFHHLLFLWQFFSSPFYVFSSISFLNVFFSQPFISIRNKNFKVLYFN